LKLNTALCDIELVMPSSKETWKNSEKTIHNYKSNNGHNHTTLPSQSQLQFSFKSVWSPCTGILYSYCIPAHDKLRISDSEVGLLHSNPHQYETALSIWG